MVNRAKSKFFEIATLAPLLATLLGALLSNLFVFFPQSVFAAEPPSKTTLLSIPKDESLPIFVKSDNLNLDSKKRIFTYVGHVEAKRGDMTIVSERMTGEYDENNKLTELVAEKEVVITRGEDLRATSNRARYDVQGGTIQLTEQPELTNKGNILSADKITLYVNEDKSDAEGDVRVKIIKTDDLAGAKAAVSSSSSSMSPKSPTKQAQ